MNQTLERYGTTNPAIVVRKIVENRQWLSAPSKDFKRANARAERYGYEEYQELQRQPGCQELLAEEQRLTKKWIHNNDIRKFHRETPTQKAIEERLKELRTEYYEKFTLPRDRKAVLLAQFIAQSYLKRNRKDFR